MKMESFLNASHACIRFIFFLQILANLTRASEGVHVIPRVRDSSIHVTVHPTHLV